MEHYWAGVRKQVGGENAKYRAYRLQMAKQSLARSAGEAYVSPGHKLSCDSRCGPDIYSHDIIGPYISLRQLAMSGSLRRLPA